MAHAQPVDKTPPAKESWSSGFAFILGAIGAAVGLGSIWRFPYLVGANGGFAFVFVFIVVCVAIVTPLLIAEILIGRWSGRSPPCAAGAIALQFGLTKRWNAIGWIGTVAGYLISTYYAMIAGWVLAYAWFFVSGTYAHGSAVQAAAKFHGFVVDWRQVALWHFGFLSCVAAISALGLNRGVEVVSKLRAPALLALMLVLTCYSLVAGDARQGLAFAFAPDLSRITPTVLLQAIGQAFFAISVGIGVMLAYGAYMPRRQSMLRASLSVTGSIVVVSLLATLIIFPLVFRYGLNPAQGPELVFQVLPAAFAVMPGGRIVGSLFFGLLFLAALTPSIAVLESSVAYLRERLRVRRPTAVLLSATASWTIGLGSVLSFGPAANWHPMAWIPLLHKANFFGILEFLTSDVLPSIATILMSFFVGWRLGNRIPESELTGFSPAARAVLLFALRYVCPVAITGILIAAFWR
jgi:neurotransmitter:Na+ symporter, NSS family